MVMHDEGSANHIDYRGRLLHVFQQSTGINKYVENVRTMSESSASQYQTMLRTFVNFAEQEYGYSVETLIENLQRSKINVYDALP
jgi:hypothetical protein